MSDACGWGMEMVNPQPLQVRPLEEEERENHLVQVPIEMDGDEGGSEYEYMNGRSAQHEAMNGGGVGVGGGGGVEVEARASGASGSASASASASASRTSELTIAFEGEVYVFPAVTPDKVCEYFFFGFLEAIYSVWFLRKPNGKTKSNIERHFLALLFLVNIYIFLVNVY